MGESVEQRADRGVDAQKPFGAKDADQSGSGRLRLGATGCKLRVAREASADFVGVLADVGLAHLGADAETVVPIDFALPLDTGRRAAQVGDGLVFELGEKVEIGGVGDGGMAAEHVQRVWVSLNIASCSTVRKFVEHDYGNQCLKGHQRALEANMVEVQRIEYMIMISANRSERWHTFFHSNTQI